jgi:hypothetical protein
VPKVCDAGESCELRGRQRAAQRGARAGAHESSAPSTARACTDVLGRTRRRTPCAVPSIKLRMRQNSG